jgi:uncharacterized membrane protein
MKPFFVLLAAFAISLAALKIFKSQWDIAFAGRIAMSVMLLFTAIAHFAFQKGMAMMLPAFIPFKKAVVYATGVIEIAAAIGLLIPGWQTATGWWLIAFFILVLPANIYAAMHKVDYQKGDLQGKGLTYLWLRVPLQIVYILWIYFFVIAK